MLFDIERRIVVNTHHLLCHLCAKSTSKISCRMMKIAPPTIPIYIQARPHTFYCHIYQTKLSHCPINTSQSTTALSVKAFLYHSGSRYVDARARHKNAILQLSKLFPEQLQTVHKIFSDVIYRRLGNSYCPNVTV